MLLPACACAAAVRLRTASTCSVDLSQKAPQGAFDFVCDTMPGGWYHGAAEAPATAGSGGCHTYKFMKGPAPSCEVNGPCRACENPEGTVVGEFFLSRDDCSQEPSC